AVVSANEAKYLAQGGLTGATIVDPLQAVEGLVGRLRAEADVVVLLADLSDPDVQRLRRQAGGVDLVLAEPQEYAGSAQPIASEARQTARRPFQPPLWAMRDFRTSLNALEVSLSGPRREEWSVRERHRLLDDSLPDAPGFRGFEAEAFGISISTETPLIPSERAVFGAEYSP